MKTIDLLTKTELPAGFRYPRQFVHIVELGLIDLQPWYVLHGLSLRDTLEGLRNRYSDRTLIPFARRQDNDDIACWDASTSEEVVIIHDFASSGWEDRVCFSSFYDWLRQAIEDLIEFDC